MAKREKPRFLAGLTATLCYAGEDRPCMALDLSAQGALLTGELPEPEQPAVTLRLESAAGDITLELAANVVHYHDDGERTRIGLQFLDLEEEQKEKIEFLIARVVENVIPASIARLTRDASVEEIREALSVISVSHRIALARRAGAMERQFLQHDTELAVVEGLARNPQLTAPEVLELLAIQQLLPTTVDLLAKDPRWRSNEKIRVLIATHPRATLTAARRAVEGLSDNGLRSVIRRPGLNPVLRQKLLSSIPTKRLKGWD